MDQSVGDEGDSGDDENVGNRSGNGRSHRHDDGDSMRERNTRATVEDEDDEHTIELQRQTPGRQSW